MFWNTYRNINKIEKCLIEIIIEKRCDVVVLAEYPDDIEKFCAQVNILSHASFIPIPNMGGCDKIKGLINVKYRVESINEQSRYQIVKIEAGAYKLLIAMLHNISKLHSSDLDQADILRIFNDDICIAEKSQNTKNTVIIGDFNANPFEPSIVSVSTVHAIPYIEEIKKRSRIVNGREYEKFYNPMWKFLGKKEAPYATFYYNRGQVVNYFYNIFDQVLIRPQLLKSFSEDSLEIISSTKTYNLLTGHKPNRKDYSDHLPIFCTIKEENKNGKFMEEKV